MKAHPIADIFPMMSDEEILSLAEDIKKRGLLEPIVMYEGMILDGRNRAAACIKANVAPNCVLFDGGNPANFVWSKNAERRHLKLNNSQKAALRLEIEKASADWEAKHAEVVQKANGARSDAAKKRSRKKDGTFESSHVVQTTPLEKKPCHSAQAHELAAATGVCTDTATKVIMAEKERPDLYEQIKEGKMSAKKADKIRREEKKTTENKVEKQNTKSDEFTGNVYFIRLSNRCVERLKSPDDDEIIAWKKAELKAILSRLRSQIYI